MEITIRQDAILDALVLGQMMGAIPAGHIDAAVEALQRYQAIEGALREIAGFEPGPLYEYSVDYDAGRRSGIELCQDMARLALGLVTDADA